MRRFMKLLRVSPSWHRRALIDVRSVRQGGETALAKNSALEDADAQNLEVVAFCEDVAA